MSKRCSHSSINIKNTIYLFGGHDAYHSLNDLYKIKIENNIAKWIKMNQSGDIPSRRWSHFMMNLLDNYIIIGFGWDNNYNIFNDIFSFNLSTNKWNKIGIINENDIGLSNMGYISNKDIMYIYGGYNKSGSLINSLYQIQFNTLPHLEFNIYFSDI